MKKIYLSIPVLFSLLFTFSCAPNNSSTNSGANNSENDVIAVHNLRTPNNINFYQQKDYEKDDKFLSFRHKLNSFICDLSSSITSFFMDKEENMVFSPLSIALNLGVIIRSSDIDIRNEILSIFDIDFATFNEYYKVIYSQLNGQLYNSNKEVVGSLLLTNSLWLSEKYQLIEDGLDALSNDYFTHLFSCDFTKKDQVNNYINNFIYENSNHFLNPNIQLLPTTSIYSQNAIYYQSLWNDYNGPSASKASLDYKFVNSDGTISNKQLMQVKNNPGKIIVQEDYSACKVDTTNGDVYIVKANGEKNIFDLLDQEKIQYVIDNSHYIYSDYDKKENYYTTCIFPEFKTDYKLDLIPLFKEIYNVNSLFDETVYNLSQIVDYSEVNNPLYCTVFDQINKIDVSVKGIEGVSITSMEFKETASEFSSIEEEFVVDREFAYFIVSNGTIVLSGIVLNIDE